MTILSGKPLNGLVFVCLLAAPLAGLAADNAAVVSLSKRGEEIFHAPASCATCHGEKGEGLVGPSIQYGPTPFDIHYQLTTNIQMAPFREAIDPTDEDLLAISVYIRRMTGTDAEDIDAEGLRATLNSVQNYAAVPGYFLTERDKALQKVESFQTVLDDRHGREFWCTSDAEGRIYVFDAVTHEKIPVIDMPLSGGPHGLVFVHYDEDGNSRVVRDQGGFHNGIDPRKGRTLIGVGAC